MSRIKHHSRIVVLILGLGISVSGCGGGTASDTYVRGTVTEIASEQTETHAGVPTVTQSVTVQILEGTHAGTKLALENGILDERRDMRLGKGETIILSRIEKSDGTYDYVVREKYRFNALMGLCLVFFLLSVALGGMTGFTSMLGLLFSIAIIVGFIVPQIAAGKPPLAISLIGASFIACISLYLAHGFNRRTSIALFATLITLCLSIGIAVIFVTFAKLFGMGTEESVFLQMGAIHAIDLRGLLLGGIVIGALGVLDDITTAQVAAIDEISKANPRLGFSELYGAGVSIGREHIASLINTLALAYAGASLPLLLLFAIDNETPLWVIINNEFLAEEIVRTLVGSSTLLFAVPISTWLAARAFRNGNHTGSLRSHPCGHRH